ncbi:MAG: DUF805 domain-containing protein [Dehalococcoidia bacterium]|jgi:uncharacterized membrane protein YhaH (DUF805 family)|nr:DUF805 domain-containing protein [Dehalococcoidia bacterium]MCH2494830.1 DUF805 domain-containing protein [Dehalococcoidia bacterium]|tara:strand:- start:805 stop:1176 length:372 start_codon:yes stop_codon:yes gene_type:complete
MNFRIAIIKCFMLYAIFSGRAKRAEFWWFFLFCMIVGLMGSVIDAALGLDAAIGGNGVFTTLIQLATFLPSIAVGSRRLHDTNRSGWWQLLWIVVFIGWIPLIIWLASTSKNENNRFGDEPTD